MAVCKITFSYPTVNLGPIIFNCASSNDEPYNALLSSFYRLQKLKKHNEVLFENVTSQQVLHAIASLYHYNLQEMEKETIYSAMVDENSFTILVICTSKQAKLKMHQKQPEKSSVDRLINVYEKLLLPPNKNMSSSLNHDDDVCSFDETYPQEDPMRLVYIGHNDESDTESIPDNGHAQKQEMNNRNNSETNPTSGYKTFLQNTFRKNLDYLNYIKCKNNYDDANMDSFLSPNNFIVGACTFNIRYTLNSKRVCHLTLLAIDKAYRKKGIGKALVGFLKKQQITGPIDALVVHADHNAIDFFKKLGFVDDILVNNSWKEFSDEYINCRLMTYLPAFSESLGKRNLMKENSSPSIYKGAIEESIGKWKSQSEEAYLSQCILNERLINDIALLTEKIKEQDEMIKELMIQLRALNQRNLELQKELETEKTRSFNL